jgi:hypothetical protein
MHLSKKRPSDIKNMTMFAFGNPILLGSMWTGGLMNNTALSTQGSERSLNKLQSIIGTKNFGCNTMLGLNFIHKLGNHR